MKIEDSNLHVGFTTEKNKTNLDTSDFEKVNNLVEDQKNGLRFTNDRSIFLFKKYLTRSQHNKGKTNMEDSEVIKRRTSGPLLPPKFGCNLNRPISFLEQELLPRLRYILFHLLNYT